MAEEEDRTYYGVTSSETGGNWIEVAKTEFGQTERDTTSALYHLTPIGMYEDVDEFTWGYTKTGPHATGLAVLADALGQEPSKDLLEAFVDDVVSQFPNEWRMRRGAVLRWARGWYAQHNIDILPAALRDLPPTSPRWLL
ncbi:DUF6166 domain-containing protein [Streptosporangium roseum]|uniref:DUF6166 domain-containing protein n=1 Tax=Streptosporangium roseum TaxID=2001 RepID=UPI003332CE41